MSNSETMQLIRDFEKLRDAGVRTLPSFMDKDGCLHHKPSDGIIAVKSMFRTVLHLSHFPSRLFDGDKKSLLLKAANLTLRRNTTMLGKPRKGLLDSLLAIEYAVDHAKKHLVVDELRTVFKVLKKSKWTRSFSDVDLQSYRTSGVDCAHTIFCYRLQRLIERDAKLFGDSKKTALVSDGIKSRCCEEVYKQVALSSSGAVSAFDMAQLAFAIVPAFDALALTPGIIERAIISCAEHAKHRPNEWLAPYYYTDRDYFVSPRIEEVISALLDAALRYCGRTLSARPIKEALVGLLAVFSDRAHISSIRGNAGLPSGWALANSSTHVELWPTLSVIETSSWAIR